MAETMKSLTWWQGKTEAEIVAHYAKAEEDALRPHGSPGDGREHGTFTCADFSCTPSMTIAEGDEDAQERIAAFFAALEDWKTANGVKAKLSDTLSAMGKLGEDAPSFSELGRTLGVSVPTARERYAAVAKYRDAIQDIARQVGLGG